MAEAQTILSGKFDGKGASIQGFNGEGVYSYENCKYIGQFKDGKFHGLGTVFLKAGGKFAGTWSNGKLVSGGYIFKDGLEHRKWEPASEEEKDQSGTGKDVKHEEWEYCSAKDPRFFCEQKKGNENDKTGMEFETFRADKVVALPQGCFDCGEGYYDPKKLSICSFETGDPTRVPDKAEKEFILKNYRKEM